jgi:predicted DNA-binding protein
MPTHITSEAEAAETRAKIVEAEAILAKDHSEAIGEAEAVRTPPISIRLSPALLLRLDRLADREHRKRSNLIQHILWEYVRAQDAAPAVVATSAKTSAMRAGGKKAIRTKSRARAT